MSSKEIVMARIGNTFQPSSPITQKDLFFGRVEQINKVINSINENGQHAVIYGDRGVGKTSLANIMVEWINGISVAKISCNSSADFKNLWESMFSRLNLISDTGGLTFTRIESVRSAQLELFRKKASSEVNYSDILLVLEKIDQPVLFIFDEFDTIINPEIKKQFSQTIKALSDSAPNITVLVVGIADTVDELIGSHGSLERCLRQIKLPKMSNEELTNIIDKGLQSLEMTIDSAVKGDIVKFSDGYPHYTHLLSKYSARKAAESDSVFISRIHFDLAVNEAVEDAYESVQHAYSVAISTKKEDAIFKQVLFSCALVNVDDNGSFKASDLEEPLSRLLNKEMRLQAYSYHLGKLCLEERGSVLQKMETEQTVRYKFRNPLLKAFVRLQYYKNKNEI
jgi:Cdc6-like AAA superfamily ATPase